MTHPKTADDRLDSWKEIAAYLDRDVRTVQRWETREGLPVHRLEHRKRGTVYAFRSEIESWRGQRSTAPRATLPGGRRLAAAAASAALLALALWWLWPSQEGISEDRMRIVVLPFQNVGEEPDYFSQGLTEELITGLGRLAPSQLGVIASTSAMHYQGTDKGIPEIAQELQVDYVIEGAIRRGAPGQDGGRQALRVDTRLIRAADATLLWTRSYDTALSAGLGLQRELASNIAVALSPSLVPDPATVPAPAGEGDWRAWEAYLRGRFLWNKATRSGFQQALASFQSALDYDPSYLPAYLGIADTYFLLAHYGLVSGDEAFPKALQAAEKALEIDPQSAEALAATAYARNLVHPEAESNESLFRRAVALHPRHPGIRRWYGAFLRSHDRQQEALQQFDQARRLDPLSSIILLDLGWCHHQLGDYAKALEFYARVEQLDPRHAKAHYLHGLTLTAMGQYRRAIEALTIAVPLSEDSPHYLYSLGDAYLKAGNPAEASRILRRLQEIATQRHVSPRLLEKLQSRIESHPATASR